MKSLFFFLCCLFCGAAIAGNTPDPMQLLQSISDQMLSSLKRERPNLKNDPDIVYRLVNKILVPHADVTGMSRSVLGREVWTNATPAEQKAFSSAFKDVVIRTYASALNAYTDETVKFYPIRGGYEDKQFIEVNSEIIRADGPSVSVNYRLSLMKGAWRLYDLNVEGVSLIESFQSQLSEEVSQGKTIGELTRELKNRKVKSEESSD